MPLQIGGSSSGKAFFKFNAKSDKWFFRGEAARSTPGSGLGLTLVAAVASRRAATARGDLRRNHLVALIGACRSVRSA